MLPEPAFKSTNVNYQKVSSSHKISPTPCIDNAKPQTSWQSKLRKRPRPLFKKKAKRVNLELTVTGTLYNLSKVQALSGFPSPNMPARSGGHCYLSESHLTALSPLRLPFCSWLPLPPLQVGSAFSPTALQGGGQLPGPASHTTAVTTLRGSPKLNRHLGATERQLQKGKIKSWNQLMIPKMWNHPEHLSPGPKPPNRTPSRIQAAMLSVPSERGLNLSPTPFSKKNNQSAETKLCL